MLLHKILEEFDVRNTFMKVLWAALPRQSFGRGNQVPQSDAVLGRGCRNSLALELQFADQGAKGPQSQ